MLWNYGGQVKETNNNHSKQVTFGPVERFEYTKVEKKVTVKKKLQGFIQDAMKIENDENLKILITSQTF